KDGAFESTFLKYCLYQIVEACLIYGCGEQLQNNLHPAGAMCGCRVEFFLMVLTTLNMFGKLLRCLIRSQSAEKFPVEHPAFPFCQVRINCYICNPENRHPAMMRGLPRKRSGRAVECGGLENR